MTDRRVAHPTGRPRLDAVEGGAEIEAGSTVRGSHRNAAAKGFSPPGAALTASLPYALAGLFLLLAGPAAAGEIWLDVDTSELVLTVMEGEKAVRAYDGIAIGRNGTSSAKRGGDQKTPLGSYHIRRINNTSRYHRFFGFDYPNMEQATAALQADRISSEQWQAINLAHQKGREPPADTPLGGNIGIHGIGSGDPGIHEEFNWTEGCIALTNEQIDELASWIKSGTRVVVR